MVVIDIKCCGNGSAERRRVVVVIPCVAAPLAASCANIVVQLFENCVGYDILYCWCYLMEPCREIL